MTTWQSNDNVRRNGGAEIDEFIDVPQPAPPGRPRDEAAQPDDADEAPADDDE